MLSLSWLLIALVANPVFASGTSSGGNLGIICQTAGFLENNNYLIYDKDSLDAALVDVSGPIDALTAFIDKNELEVRYIFVTHWHSDHIFGLAAIRKRYPDAKVCMSRFDFEEPRHLARWDSPESKIDSAEIAEIKSNPAALEIMNFDFSNLKAPDIYVEDGQHFKLGKFEVTAILSPGHSSGSICYYVDGALFSGDVLFCRSVGRTDLNGMSWDDIVVSVRRLYSLLPDETVVYPGHGEFTDIASEKLHNKRVRPDSTNKRTEQQ